MVQYSLSGAQLVPFLEKALGQGARGSSGRGHGSTLIADVIGGLLDRITEVLILSVTCGECAAVDFRRALIGALIRS